MRKVKDLKDLVNGGITRMTVGHDVDNFTSGKTRLGTSPVKPEPLRGTCV
jgi:hypothetical protein